MMECGTVFMPIEKAREGWWCRREAGHDGPCAVEHLAMPMGPAPKAEAVDHPAHYRKGGIEAIDVIEAWELNFSLGCVVKYVSRAGKKPGEDELQDLRKSAWYLNREIGRIEASRK